MPTRKRRDRCPFCGAELTRVAWVTDPRTGERRYARSYGKRCFVWCGICGR